jgi:initiation factor 1A
MYQTSIRNKKKPTNFNRDKEINYDINGAYEEYAYVIKLLGNCRARVICNDGTEAIGVIRGSMRKFNKRILIENGDIVVISKRDYQKEKVDIVHKFNSEQCQNLIKSNTISKTLTSFYHKQADYNDDKNKTTKDYNDCIFFEDNSDTGDIEDNNIETDNESIDLNMNKFSIDEI